MADEQTTRWTVTVSKQADKRLRTYLAERGLKKGALSRFVEDAVRWRVLDQTIADARSKFSDLSAKELQDVIDEALAWARSEPPSKLQRPTRG
jgi:hypothetical protein